MKGEVTRLFASSAGGATGEWGVPSVSPDMMLLATLLRGCRNECVDCCREKTEAGLGLLFHDVGKCIQDLLAKSLASGLVGLLVGSSGISIRTPRSADEDAIGRSCCQTAASLSPSVTTDVTTSPAVSSTTLSFMVVVVLFFSIFWLICVPKVRRSTISAGHCLLCLEKIKIDDKQQNKKRWSWNDATSACNAMKGLFMRPWICYCRNGIYRIRWQSTWHRLVTKKHSYLNKCKRLVTYPWRFSRRSKKQNKFGLMLLHLLFWYKQISDVNQDTSRW